MNIEHFETNVSFMKAAVNLVTDCLEADCMSVNTAISDEIGAEYASQTVAKLQDIYLPILYHIGDIAREWENAINGSVPFEHSIQ